MTRVKGGRGSRKLRFFRYIIYEHPLKSNCQLKDVILQEKGIADILKELELQEIKNQVWTRNEVRKRHQFGSVQFYLATFFGHCAICVQYGGYFCNNAGIPNCLGNLKVAKYSLFI